MTKKSELPYKVCINTEQLALGLRKSIRDFKWVGVCCCFIDFFKLILKKKLQIYIEWNVRFTLVPIQSLSYQELTRYSLFFSWKISVFYFGFSVKNELPHCKTGLKSTFVNLACYSVNGKAQLRPSTVPLICSLSLNIY